METVFQFGGVRRSDENILFFNDRCGARFLTFQCLQISGQRFGLERLLVSGNCRKFGSCSAEIEIERSLRDDAAVEACVERGSEAAWMGYPGWRMAHALQVGASSSASAVVQQPSRAQSADGEPG